MACGCKAKKNVEYIDPVASKKEQLQLQFSNSITSNSTQQNSQVQLVLTRSGKTYVQIRRQLDTSSMTKPDQLCFNCIRKHLALASKLSQLSRFHDRLAALGQLLCVVQHLKQTHPNLTYRIRDMIIVTLRDPKLTHLDALIKQLILQFQHDPKEDSKEYIPLPSFTQQQELLMILLVQSLLFIQITYQEVNKTWATAELSFMSYNAFRTQNSLRAYETYRPLWKLIQSMHPLDQNYMAARDYIYSLIVSKYPYYQQIVLPRKKEQLQRDYEKQKELMQKLQEEKSLPQSS